MATGTAPATVNDGTSSYFRHGNVVRLMRHAWQQRRILLRASVAGAVLSTVVALLIPNTYRSTVRLMPPANSDRQGAALMSVLNSVGGPGGGDAGAALAGELLGGKSNGALFISVLRSRTVADRLINEFDLRKEYRVKTYEAARLKLAENTEVSEDRKSGVITIDVFDHSPDSAKRLAQVYVGQLDQLVTKLNTSAAGRERAFLEERLVTVKRDLDQYSKDLSEFSSKNTTFDTRDQAKAALEAAARIQGELIAAESILHEYEAIYTPNNVRVKSARARVESLRSSFEKLRGSARESDNAPSGDLPTIRDIPKLGMTYADLYQRARIQQAVFETLTKQLEIAKVQEAREIPSVRILDEPQVPERKAGPHRLPIIVLGTLSALFLAVCFVMLQSRFNKHDISQLWADIAEDMGRR